MRVLPVANPSNPWAKTVLEYWDGEAPHVPIKVYEDHTRQILSKNDSPDVGFTWSVNPYRGCFHACAYCYARPSHEYLSFGAGTDFDRKIVLKPDAAALLREAFDKKSWRGECVVFSGVTDCYQPLEASYALTRGCLDVCVAYKNPAGIITKSPLIERDIDLLQELSRVATAHVTVSVPFINVEHARAIEPHVATPERRLHTIGKLAKAGISVGVNVAPIIPGLNDEQMGEVLKAARDQGAVRAGYVMLRLPGAVKAVFEERLRATLPLRADKVMNRIRETRGGALYDPRFGTRGTGEGPYAEATCALFEATAKRLGLNGERLEVRDTFERPSPPGQLRLF